MPNIHFNRIFSYFCAYFGQNFWPALALASLDLVMLCLPRLRRAQETRMWNRQASSIFSYLHGIEIKFTASITAFIDTSIFTESQSSSFLKAIFGQKTVYAVITVQFVYFIASDIATFKVSILLGKMRKSGIIQWLTKSQRRRSKIPQDINGCSGKYSNGTTRNI